MLKAVERIKPLEINQLHFKAEVLGEDLNPFLLRRKSSECPSLDSAW